MCATIVVFDEEECVTRRALALRAIDMAFDLSVDTNRFRRDG